MCMMCRYRGSRWCINVIEKDIKVRFNVPSQTKSCSNVEGSPVVGYLFLWNINDVIGTDDITGTPPGGGI